MTDRPILFSAPMVRALRRAVNPKTQTRRLVKAPWQSLPLDNPDYQREAVAKCPYGVPGDKLWVRESYRFGAEWDDTKPSEVPPIAFSEDGPHRYLGVIHYEADGQMKRPADGGWGKLRPGMFMPRWGSRITLELVSVRAERLQDISEDDAIAEGWEKQPERSADPTVHRDAARDWYSDLWDTINGPGSWAANPYVWALEFARC